MLRLQHRVSHSSVTWLLQGLVDLHSIMSQSGVPNAWEEPEAGGCTSRL